MIQNVPQRARCRCACNLTRSLCDSLNRTSKENCSIQKSLFSDNLSPTRHVVFSVLFTYTLKAQNTKLVHASTTASLSSNVLSQVEFGPN